MFMELFLANSISPSLCQLPMILKAIEHALLTSKSMAVEHEALDVMYRLSTHFIFVYW